MEGIRTQPDVLSRKKELTHTGIKKKKRKRKKPAVQFHGNGNKILQKQGRGQLSNAAQDLSQEQKRNI